MSDDSMHSVKIYSNGLIAIAGVGLQPARLSFLLEDLVAVQLAEAMNPYGESVGTSLAATFMLRDYRGTIQLFGASAASVHDQVLERWKEYWPSRR